MPTNKRQNHFLLPVNEYTRDLNVIKHYTRDAALYLHKRTGKPLEECERYVKLRTDSEGTLAINDPQVSVLTRNEYGDRENGTTTLNQFLRDIEVNKRILSPSMTVYHPADKLKSLASEFIEVNIKRRGASKKAQFKAKEEGNVLLEEFKKNEQKSFKISNNSLSGAQASSSTILYNKSAHPSLTSTCRTATSYGNANNEKFLFGNRHYWSPEIVKGNIISIIRVTDYALLENGLVKYGIRTPTYEETCECIRYSTDLYWNNKPQLELIFKLVATLTDLERAAFVYTADLYHLAKYNDTVVRVFLDKLSSQATSPIDNPEVYLDQLDNDLSALVSLLCADKLNGTSISKVKDTNPDAYKLIGATAKHILGVLDEYQWLIKGLWRVKTLPASVANIRSSLRRGVITSDTDSTIFSVQQWTQWFVGKLDFTEKSNGIAYAVVYLATQTIAHLLAMVSASMGVAKEHTFTLSMKNEFAFPVFALTSMAKHYFAYISAQEGNVFPTYETEIKGVYLKDSNAPPHIMQLFGNTLRSILDQVIAGNGINLTELLTLIAGIENDIYANIQKGSVFYLNGAQVKDATAYVKPGSSPYVHYQLWQAVFAPRYGDATPPPYAAVKVSVDLGGKNKIVDWLATFQDRALAARMENWLAENRSSGLKTLLLPRNIVEESGIPKEIISAMNIRKIIYGTVKPFYILLETLGICLINKDLTRLVSDMVVNPNP